MTQTDQTPQASPTPPPEQAPLSKADILAERSPVERVGSWILRRWWALAVLAWGGVISNQFGTIATTALSQIVHGHAPTFDGLQSSWAASAFKSNPVLGAILAVGALGITGAAFFADRAEQARLKRLAELAEVKRQQTQRAEIHAETRQMLEEFFQQRVQPHEGEEAGEDDSTARPAAAAVVLPARPALVVGRDNELEQVRLALIAAGTTAVALRGMGGVGKSTLLAEALYRCNEAQTFPAGVIWLACNDLVGDEGEARLYDAAALALGRSDVTQIVGLMAKATALRHALAGRRMLIALDNVEADLPLDRVISTLTVRGANAVGGVVVLATRVSWPDIPGLVEIDLDVLSTAQGFTLLETLVARSGRALAPDEAPAARDIVAAVGALPLALELVAPRIARRTEPLATLAARLRDEGAQLKGRTRGIERTFDVTYDQLDATQQAAFGALAVFAGVDFSQDAAMAAVGAILRRAADPQVLTDLADLSLLKCVNQVAGAPRYQLHPLLRQFARDRLRERDNGATATDIVALAVAQYYRDFVRQHTRKFHDDLNILEADYGNLLGVLTWAHEHMEGSDDFSHEATEILSNMSIALRRFFTDNGHWTDGRRVLLWGVDASTRSGETARATSLLGALGFIARMQGDLDQAEQYNLQALELARGRHDQHAEGARIASLGTIARTRGDFTLARSRYEESLALRRRLRDRGGISATLRLLGGLIAEQGQWDEARTYLREALENKDTPGASRARTFVELASINIRDPQGDRDQARKLLDTALTTTRQFHQLSDEANVLDWLGALDLEEGQIDAARAQWEAALAIYTRLGSSFAGQTRERLARIASAQPVAVKV